MKRYLFPVVLFTCLLLSANIQAQNLSWYKWLTGAIDKYPVSMHLHKTGHTYSGYYYYNKTQQPIYFTGTDTTIKNAIELNAYTEDAENSLEQFIFTITGNNITGTWQKDKKSSKLNFSAAQKIGDAATNFTVVFTNGDIKLRPKLAESPTAIYEASAVWPTGNTAKDEFIKTTIRKIFNAKGDVDIGAYFIADKKETFSQYREDFKEEKDEDLKERSYSYSIEVTRHLLIMFQSEKFISMGDYSYAYTGGAHGNYGTGYHVLDLLNMKELSIKDVLNEAGQKALPNILEAQFRTDHNLMSTDSLQEGGLFENKIAPTDNFFITPNGIGFCYMPYEIGPYVMGEIEIFIPFTDLTEYLQSTTRELIKK
ncbi:hypothetical protein BH10BAC2_BH10BAC2_07180 [soil metagenome]